MYNIPGFGIDICEADVDVFVGRDVLDVFVGRDVFTYILNV